jgi:hypothetical protein
MGIMVALFYLNAKKMTDVNITKLKKEAASIGYKVTKAQNISKEQLTFTLGKELLLQEKVKRIDVDKPVTRDNLVISNL